MSIEVTGASDDLIEIDGDISEEFYPLSDATDGSLLAFSNGVVLRIVYSHSGVWRITPVANGSQVTIEQAPEDDDANYTDKATLLTPASWVVIGTEIAKAAGVFA